MPEDVPDGLKRGSVLEKMDRKRVAQAMRALEGNAETAFPNQGLKSFRDSRWFQHANGRTHSQKDPSIGPWRWSPLQMLHDRGRNFVRQW